MIDLFLNNLGKKKNFVCVKMVNIFLDDYVCVKTGDPYLASKQTKILLIFNTNKTSKYIFILSMNEWTVYLNTESD